MPPYSAYGCAFQVRTGNDGRRWVSQPNDKGQFVWVPVPKTLGQKIKSGGRRLVKDYGPMAAEYYAWKAAQMLHKGLLPGIDYDNHQVAWGTY